MTDLFGSDPAGTDFSSLYTDDSAPKAPDPSQQLFDSLSSAAKAASAAVPAASGAASTPAPGMGAARASGSTAAAPVAAAPAAPQQSPDQVAMLARLAPKGITSLDQLKGKTDVELRKLSTDVVAYEMRQKSLDQFFKKNPDGTYDLTMGPDGSLTGLDATGKVSPAAGTTPATPAAPSQPAPVAPKASVKRPAAKKPAPKKPAARKPAPRKVTQARKPAPKRPAPRASTAAPRVAQPVKDLRRQ